MKNILVRLQITLVISLLFGGIAFLFGDSFIRWFLYGILFQFIVSPMFYLLLKTWGQININKLKVSRMNAIDQNSTELLCAKCNAVNKTMINVNSDENSFTCKECGTVNNIYVEIRNAQKTNIVYKKNVITEEDIKDLKDE